MGAASLSIEQAGVLIKAEGTDGTCAKFFFHGEIEVVCAASPSSPSRAADGATAAQRQLVLAGIESTVPVAAGKVFKLTVAVPGVDDAEFDTMSRWFVAHLRGKLSGGCTTASSATVPNGGGAARASRHAEKTPEHEVQVQAFHSATPAAAEG